MIQTNFVLRSTRVNVLMVLEYIRKNDRCQAKDMLACLTEAYPDLDAHHLRRLLTELQTMGVTYSYRGFSGRSTWTLTAKTKTVLDQNPQTWDEFRSAFYALNGCKVYKAG